jgi:Transglycosylase SLT domain
MYRAGSFAAVILIVLASLTIVRSQQALEAANPARAAAQHGDSRVKLLSDAMNARIAIGTDRRTGRTIPASHCRHAAGGCEERLSKFAHYLVDAGRLHGIDPWLMAAMAFKESGFNPFAMGSLGELGILQINPGRRDAKTVRFIRDEWYRKRCRNEPGACQREIVEHAAQVLSRSLELCGGDLSKALGAYNTGRCGGNRRYSERVLLEVEELRKMVGLKGTSDSAPAQMQARRS